MTEREQFEAAMRAYCDPARVEETFYREGDNYEAYATLFAWEAWQAARATPADQVCATCNGHGMIGGPSFYAPDEGGEPCPDCAAPADRMDAMQEKVIACGFKYWRASDAHGVVGTVKQAENFIADLIGVEVEIKND